MGRGESFVRVLKIAMTVLVVAAVIMAVAENATSRTC
jgi:hypothetical protein